MGSGLIVGAFAVGATVGALVFNSVGGCVGAPVGCVGAGVAVGLLVDGDLVGREFGLGVGEVFGGLGVG